MHVFNLVGRVIRCTLWGKAADEWNHPVGTVIAIKAASLSDFNGCSMSIGMSSKFEVKSTRATQPAF